MATAFDTFNQYASAAFEGQLADEAMADIVSRLASGSDIGYGLAVADDAYRSATLPATGATVTGITLRETVQDNPAGDNPTPVYEQDHAMSMLRVGRIWVATTDGAAVGDSVYFVPDTGVLTNTDSAGANELVPNAVFKSAAGAGELAIVQLNGSD